MNDLYTHQLETENKQLRIALQTTRKLLEEQQDKIDKAIDYIKNIDNICVKDFIKEQLLEILGDKE